MWRLELLYADLSTEIKRFPNKADAETYEYSLKLQEDILDSNIIEESA